MKYYNSHFQKVFLYVLTIVSMVSFSSCNKNDLDDIYERLDKIESKDVEKDSILLKSFSFLANDNEQLLLKDVQGTIIGDSIVECWNSHLLSKKILVPEIVSSGDIKINGIAFQKGQTYDFSKPVSLTISNESTAKEYTVYLHSYTGLPVLYIETEGWNDIASKEDYIQSHMRLTEDVATRAPGETIECDLQIKGRGNSTWSEAKKPYRIKLDQKLSLLGEPADKSWVLLANYYDKTMLRHYIAFFMGEMSQLDYTPRSHFVELFLNNRYWGTYQLCEKLKIAEHRVNVGKDGFLLEVDAKATEDDVTFSTPYISYIKDTEVKTCINVKEPDNITAGDDNYNYIKDYVTNAENILFSDGFTDSSEGWQKFIDMDSFVDWYLINEITRNCDANFNTSCFMNLRRGEKLKMGPLWDFDRAFGNTRFNNNWQVEGLYIKESTYWFDRLFQDPSFVKQVKNRFDFLYSRRSEIYNKINEYAGYLSRSAVENENRWGTLYERMWPEYGVWGGYDNEVQYMKDWLERRFVWLKGAFDAMI